MRIGIVSESAATVQSLLEQVTGGSHHRVVGTARNAAEAVEMCCRNRPDVVLLDLSVTEPGCVETTRRIMAGAPCAILVVTDSVAANAERVFDAMGAGAIDAVAMAAEPSGLSSGPHLLLSKLDLISRLIGDADRPSRAGEPVTSGFGATRLVAIGASAGGPAALTAILGALPGDFPAAVAIVQHLDEQFANGLVEWLGQYSTLPVRIAGEGDLVRPGVVVVAGTGNHLVLTSAERFGYTPHPAEHVYRPSVDVFFESVNRKWQGDAIGVLLTGMGRDGARGLKALRDTGHHTIAQDEASSALYGMPKAAAAMHAAAEILSIERIAGRLLDLVTSARVRRVS
jgi:chemotaxis response regulator CheB